MLTRVGDVHDEGIDEAPGKAHANPGSDHDLRRHRIRDAVVEQPVQMRQGHVNDDARYGSHEVIVPPGCDRPPAMPPRTRLGPGGHLERIRPIGALPGEVGKLAPEVPVGRGGPVDGSEQVQIPNDRCRA